MGYRIADAAALAALEDAAYRDAAPTYDAAAVRDYGLASRVCFELGVPSGERHVVTRRGRRRAFRERERLHELAMRPSGADPYRG